MCSEKGNTKKAKQVSKAQLVSIALDNELADMETVQRMTKDQLHELIGDIPEQNRLQQVTLSGTQLSPQCMCSFDNVLYLYDASTRGIWRVELSKVACGIPTLIANLPNIAVATSISCSTSNLYLASPENNGGLFCCCLDSKNITVLQQNSSSLTVYGVCSNEHVVAFTDKCSNQVYRRSGEGIFTVLSGISQTGGRLASTDGFSASCAHAQPGPLCAEEKTVYVCDMASSSVRLISDVSTLIKYHHSITQVYKAFSIHSEKHGFRETCTPDIAVQQLKDACNTYRSMMDGIHQVTNNPHLKPNGPHGCLPFVTIEMFEDLTCNMSALCQLIASVNPAYQVQTSALLSVPCEHHFATMRARYAMPTILQYCELLNTVIDETMKRLTISDYKYYTSKESYYPKPALQSVERVKSHRIAEKSKAQMLSKTEQQLMLNWRKDHCAGKKHL